MDCQWKKVIVTGGSSGYGYGIAKKLKEKGADVLIASRNLDTLKKVADELNVDYIQADVSNALNNFP